MTRHMLLFAALMLQILGLRAQTTSVALQTPSMASQLPPAPNAYELTKYAGIPVNLSTGAVTQAIPLGEITQGKLSVPISLSYNGGNGVKVDQMASRAGINWTLNAGGVVSRTVSGKPDESSTWRGHPGPSATNEQLWTYLDEVGATVGVYDGEPDIFSFSFNGHSGQFMLDQTDKTKVIHLSASPLRVETNFGSSVWNIRITTPDGTQYEFGGSTATEETRTSPSGPGCGKNYDSYIPTAWYLKKIRHYAGDEINFSYTAITFDYWAAVSETLIRTPPATLLDYHTEIVPCGDRSTDQICGSLLRSKGVLLTEISSALYSVSFSYQSRPDSEGDGLISGVSFYRSQLLGPGHGHRLYKSWSMGYTYSSNNKQANPQVSTTYLISRPFLTTLSGPEDYLMRYYNMNGLPARLSFSQDHWGYYNDRPNTHLIPGSLSPADLAIFPAGMANRDPDGSRAYYGLLSSITYPTGGRDSLIYEPNTVYESRMSMPGIVNTNIGIQGTGTSTEQVTTYYFNNYSSRSVNLNLTTSYGGGVNDGIHQLTNFDIYGPSNNLLYHWTVKVGESLSLSLPLSTATYRLEVHAHGQAAIGNAEITYQPQGSMVTANYQVGGVRLARNISRPLVGAPLQKRFIYAPLAQQGRSSGYLRNQPLGEEHYADLPIHEGDDNKQCLYRTAHSTPLRPLTFFSGGHIYYTDVIEVNDDNWQNGGIAHHFTGGDGVWASSVMGNPIQGPPQGNAGFAAGLEDRTVTFKKTGGSFGAYTTATLAETKTHYKMDTRLQLDVEAHTVRRKWQPSSTYTPKMSSDFTPFDVAKYTLRRQWTYVDTVATTVYDMNAANPSTTTQVTLYNQTGHLQPNEVKTALSDGRTNRLTMKYPEEMVADGVTTPYQAMKDQHRIAPEIVKRRYIDTALMETVTTRYDGFGGSIIEPAEVKFRQGHGTERSFVTVHAYDATSKLLSQSQTGGPKVSYLYGYLGTRLVAECTNATQGEFFHQNFEDTVTDTTGVPHTGDRFHSGAYYLNWAVPNGRSYVLTYWYLDGATWKFATAPYTGPTTLNLGSGIDDVSVFPRDAQLKAYTYDLAAGISSMTDEKGLVTYYEYDSRQRLETVRDRNRDIVKRYRYQLSGPLIEYFNTVQSQSFTKACVTGTGTSHVYTVPAGTYASVVSLADANNQALAEIAANGQANANANGSCVSGSISLSYVNNVPGSSITSLVVKDGSGTVLYTFNNAQLSAGITIPQGTYTFVFTVSGTGWGTVWVGTSGYFGSAENIGAGSYTITGVNLAATSGTIYLDGYF